MQHTCATKDEPPHTPRRCHLCCLLPAPRSFSLSVSRPLLWCRLCSLSPLSFSLPVSRLLLWCRLCSLSPLSFSLSVSPQPVCVCVCVCVYVCDHSCAFCTLPCTSRVPCRAYDLFNAPFCPCSIGLPPTPSGTPLKTSSSGPVKLLSSSSCCCC